MDQSELEMSYSATQNHGMSPSGPVIVGGHKSPIEDDQDCGLSAFVVGSITPEPESSEKSSNTTPLSSHSNHQLPGDSFGMPGGFFPVSSGFPPIVAGPGSNSSASLNMAELIQQGLVSHLLASQHQYSSNPGSSSHSPAADSGYAHNVQPNFYIKEGYVLAIEQGTHHYSSNYEMGTVEMESGKEFCIAITNNNDYGKNVCEVVIISLYRILFFCLLFFVCFLPFSDLPKPPSLYSFIDQHL